MNAEIVIFGGSAHPELADEICRYLSVPRSPVRITRFANDCLQVQLQANCRERDVYLIQPLVAPVQENLATRGLAPGEHYLDAGYPSAALVRAASEQGITMVTPLRPDTSPQARADTGYAKDAFRIDWKARQVRCPEGRTSSGWYPVRQHGHDAIVVDFARSDCRPCPAREQCTASRRGTRMLTLQPRELHQALTAARTEQKTDTWQAKYALRAGIEGTINQALDVTGIRRARYRGLPKVRLQHAFSAAALNVIRLDAHWSTEGTPPALSRASRLTHLSYRLTA